jgi:lysophospholipid acyltransferase (LPLAT)-like uncharacterized protein
MLPLLYYFTQSQYIHTHFYTFISPHRDGEYITRAAKGLGINALRTSRRDRRLRAIGRAIKLADNGKNLALTPDGPVGPSFEAKQGIIRLSEKTRLPILPASSLPTRGHVFSSWDHFVFPYPLSRIHTQFSTVFRPWEKDMDLEGKTQCLEENLNNLTANLTEEHIQLDKYSRFLPTHNKK